MAKQQGKGKPVENGFRGFVNYQLSKDEREALKAEAFDREQFSSQIERLLDVMLTIKFGYDSYNRCFQVTLGHLDPKHADYGIFLSGRGSDPLKALKQALYIHYTVTDGDWSSWLEKPANQEIDD